MEEFFEALAEALENMVLYEWCVRFADADDNILYHVHVHIPSTDARLAVSAAAAAAVEENVDIHTAVALVASVVLEATQDALAEVERLRKQQHGKQSKPFTEDPPEPDAPKGPRHLH